MQTSICEAKEIGDVCTQARAWQLANLHAMVIYYLITQCYHDISKSTVGAVAIHVKSPAEVAKLVAKFGKMLYNKRK